MRCLSGPSLTWCVCFSAWLRDPGFGGFRRFRHGTPTRRGFGGFLARFLGHTPSFRRFRRINHYRIAYPWRRGGFGSVAGQVWRPVGVLAMHSTEPLPLVDWIVTLRLVET